MKPLALMLMMGVAAACGTRKTQTRVGRPEPGNTSPAETVRPVIKQVLLAWSTESATPAAVEPPQTKVYLAVTDEMGRQVSYPLGTYQGSCADQGPAEAYRAATVLQCWWAGAGVQLQAVVGTGEVVILSMDVGEGVEPDPMARKQVHRIQIPIDAKVSVGS